VKAELVGPSRLPGATTSVIRVHLDTKSREGPQDKEVKIYVNDPATKDKTAAIRVRCDVQLGILTSTGVLSFGNLAKGHTGTQVLRLRSPKTDPEWHVTGVEGSHRVYPFQEIVRPPETDPVFRVVDVIVTHPGDSSGGQEGGSDLLRVRTTSADRPEVLVTATWRTVTKYFAKPPRIVFGLVGGDVVAMPFTLRVDRADPEREIPLTDARVEGRGFVATKPEKQPLGDWTIRVTPDPARLSPGPIDAVLVVTFDDPEMRELKIPLFATVRGAPPPPPK
jgi:hypothetical protein